MDARVRQPLTPSLTDTPGGKSLFLSAGRRCATLAVAVTLLAAAGGARAEEPKPMPADKPTGVLFIAGGGRLPDAVRRHFVELAGGKSARLVVIPTASVKAEQPNLLETPTFFRALDVKSVGCCTRATARSPTTRSSSSR
jgi:hypothetical protein